MTFIGHGLPAMMPVRIFLNLSASKSGCSKSAINIVGTPWNAVIFSVYMQCSDFLGENAVIGDIALPCVTHAVIARTIPKQWNIGTWIIISSAVERSMQSPIFFPLFTTL